MSMVPELLNTREITVPRVRWFTVKNVGKKETHRCSFITDHKFT